MASELHDLIDLRSEHGETALIEDCMRSIPFRKIDKRTLRAEKEENPLLSSASESVASYDNPCNLDYSSSDNDYEEAELTSALGATHILVSVTRAVCDAHFQDSSRVVDLLDLPSLVICAFDPTKPMVSRDTCCSSPSPYAVNAEGHFESRWSDTCDDYVSKASSGNRVKIRRHMGQDAVCVALLNGDRVEIGRTEPLNLRFPTLRFLQGHGLREHELDSHAGGMGTIWISVELFPPGSTIPHLENEPCPREPSVSCVDLVPVKVPDVTECMHCGGEVWQKCNDCQGTRHQFCRHCYGKEELCCGVCGGFGWTTLRLVGIGHRFSNSVKRDQALSVVARQRCEVCWGMPLLCPKCIGVGHTNCHGCFGLGRQRCTYCNVDQIIE